MHKKWIHLSLFGTLSFFTLTSGIAFGIKNKTYTVSILNTYTKTLEINKKDFEKIKHRKTIKIKLDSLSYYAKFKLVKHTKKGVILLLDYRYKNMSELVNVVIELNEQPIIYQLIKYFRLQQ
ncbi:hypothetical protein [Ureaplasma canigenitalium]|uniref:hypothetical protein n=1 Tax=Ureaplasma canigenitalium TaxID=42092 RepID=UPI00068EFF44|nr:hypothetical protein [Ureaplasma canigenitalium]